MRRSLLARLLTAHTVTVERFDGTNGAGADVFLPAATVPGFLDQARKIVRASDGSEIVSEATFYTTLDHAAAFTTDSRVTAPDGTTARVVKVNVLDSAGIAGRVEHVAVTLT